MIDIVQLMSAILFITYLLFQFGSNFQLWPFSFQQQLDFRNNQFPTTDGSFGLDEWPIKHLGDHHEEKSTEFHNQWK